MNKYSVVFYGIDGSLSVKEIEEKDLAAYEAMEGFWIAQPIEERKVKVFHIHCPVNGWDCPYYMDRNHSCVCALKRPEMDCDDFCAFWDSGDDFIDDDWVVEV